MDEANSSNGPRRKGCGRRKIEMKKIDNQRKRWVSFSKRKKGLLNKATQFSKMSGEDVGVVIISEQGRVYTSDNVDAVLQRHDLLSQHNIGSNDHVDQKSENDRLEVIDDDQDDRVGCNQADDVSKNIRDGEEEELSEYREILVDVKKNAESRMMEIKGKRCLFDLNKLPDEQ